MTQLHSLDDAATAPAPFGYPPLERGMDLPVGVNGAARHEFRNVVKAFALAFTKYRVGGGALCLYVDGEPVLDLWAGKARTGHEWTRDTTPVIFSASKGLTATVIHRLVDRGLLDYGAPVAQYWPEFAANGKEHITVDEILSHAAGLYSLNGIANDYTEMCDPELMATRLAAAPVGKLYGKPIYHALTVGWLLGKLASIVTGGKTLEELYRTELAEPLGVDGIYLGRPPADAVSQPAALTPHLARVTKTQFYRRAAPAAFNVLGRLPGFEMPDTLYKPGVEVIIGDDGSANAPVMDMRLGAGSACCSASALGKLYAALAGDGSVGGTRFLSPEITAGLARKNNYKMDRSLGIPMSWHRGYHSVSVPVIGSGGFGHIGMGGSLGWADQRHKFAFAIVHNRIPSTLIFDQVIMGLMLPVIFQAVRATR